MRLQENKTRDLRECQTEKKYKLLFVADVRGKWDSVASVYKAVIERDDCDVDVVIQPIFRMTKLADGSTRTEVIYEDYLTEQGIKHIPYEKYKMEEELPDITFISQPYESVTVPMFWPENIAKYSKLVYLPYFTALTINSNISSALNSLIHMDIQKQAWRIACQTETMADYYRGMASQGGQNVIVSGLPKWDEVVNPREEFTQCPKEWEQKLAGKKVFIWNTHFTVDNSPSAVLTKGREFLELFSGRKDIALIWRPHPMTPVILKTYTPERYPEYEKLLAFVKESDNMVLDMGASYMPAFVRSDALITDFSSLMEQYLFMDKPILMLVNGSIEAGRTKYHTVDGLFDFTKIPFASTIEEQLVFINSVVEGKDEGREDRKALRKTYFSLADGNCGERFASAVLAEYEKEMQNTEKDDVLYNVVLIGALANSKTCIEQLADNGIEFLMCEEFLAKEDGNTVHKTISLQEITENPKSCFVITEKVNAESIRRFIMQKCGIKREQILLFWQIYDCGVPVMVCDRIMQNPGNGPYDGIILGISHTEVGIVKERLKGNFCNLAVSSQDLYFQYKTLEYCVEKYFEKIKNLKYAIIDLYDYHYFNYNTSYSKSATKYLLYGGYNLDPHDYDVNKLNTISFEEVVNRINAGKVAGITEEDYQLFMQLFPDVYEQNNYQEFCPNFDDLRGRTKVVTDAEIKGYEYSRTTVTKIHKGNITANVNALRNLMQLLKLINPEIKIYTVVIPKYIETEVLDAAGLKAHEGYFNAVVEDLKKTFDFTHLDFKKISKISRCRNYYYDAAHLNYFGALQLTDELNNIIFE